MDLPRRCAATRRRPSSASRISPGTCGRQTQSSVSSTSAMRRPSADRSITARADSTSGSSGTRSVSPPGQAENRSWAAFMAGHSPSARRQAVRSQSRHVHAPPSLAATTLPITRPIRSRRVVTSSGESPAVSLARYADLAPPTTCARSRPIAVSRIARLRRSGPGARVTRPAASSRSTRRTAPDGVRPSTWCTRSTVPPSRNWASAESAAASVTEPTSSVTARPSSSLTTSASAPSTLARARSASGWISAGSLTRAGTRSPAACSGSRPASSCSTPCR